MVSLIISNGRLKKNITFFSCLKTTFSKASGYYVENR